MTLPILPAVSIAWATPGQVVEATAMMPLRSGLAAMRSLAICAARSAVPPANCGASSFSLGYLALARACMKPIQALRLEAVASPETMPILRPRADALDEFVDDGRRRGLRRWPAPHRRRGPTAGASLSAGEELDALRLGGLDHRGDAGRVEHADPIAPTPWSDQVLDDLQLVDRIGVDRARIDEFDAERLGGLLAARLHGVEIGDADDLRHEGDVAVSAAAAGSAAADKGEHRARRPVHLFIGMLLQCWGNRRAMRRLRPSPRAPARRDGRR